MPPRCSRALTALGLRGEVASDALGVASATKMCRSIMIKGLEAMVIESFTTARAYGVEDAVHRLAAAKPSPASTGRSRAPYFFQRVIEHGRRRSEEVREVAETVRDSRPRAMVAPPAPPSARPGWPIWPTPGLRRTRQRWLRAQRRLAHRGRPHPVGDRREERPMKTQVAIIGGGPAGLLLSEILHRSGVSSVVLERHSRAYVLARIRAGILEPTRSICCARIGLGARMDPEGHPHDGMAIAWAGREQLFINCSRSPGQTVHGLRPDPDHRKTSCGARRRRRATADEAEDVRAARLKSDASLRHLPPERRVAAPRLRFHRRLRRLPRRVAPVIPAACRVTYEKVYPFGWLGMLSRDAAVARPLPTANIHAALRWRRMRSPMLSRYYVQCELDDQVEDWPDDRFWNEFRRASRRHGRDIVTGPSIEKSIAPLRSFVAEPMRHGRLFLAGDAAHIVPPTGRQGSQSGGVRRVLPGARAGVVLPARAAAP